MRRVCWRNIETGKTGHGDPVSDSSAEAWVKAMNTQYPYIKHWTEPVKNEKKVNKDHD